MADQITRAKWAEARTGDLTFSAPTKQMLKGLIRRYANGSLRAKYNKGDIKRMAQDLLDRYDGQPE